MHKSSEFQTLETIIHSLNTQEITSETKQRCLDVLRASILARRFAQPALRAVFYDSTEAKFLDDFLWNHVGDPTVVGHWKSKGPGDDDGLSTYDHNYTQSIMNGFTATGDLLHLRYTGEPDVSRLQRYSVIIGNMQSGQIARYRINDIQTDVSDRTGNLTERLIITTDALDSHDGLAAFESTTTATDIRALNDAVVARDQRHNQQAFVQLGQSGIYKSFAGEEQRIGSISRVVTDRHYLSKLAIAAGVLRYDESPIHMPYSHLHPKTA